MKTFNGIPKKEWWYTYKLAFSHQYFAWILVPCFLVSFYVLILAIIKGAFSAIIMGLIFSLLIGWVNCNGFYAMYLCKKFGIDYNKPWDEV